MTSRALEYWYPRLAGLLAVIVYLLAFRRTPISEAWKEILNAAVTLASITVGFLITTAATLLSVQESNVVIRRARRAGAYRDLVEYIISGARWNFAAALLSAAGMLLDLAHPRGWYPYGFAIWIGVAVVAALTITRIFKLLIAILRMNADPDL